MSEKDEWEGLEHLGADALEELRPRVEVALLAVGVYLAGQIKVTLTGQRHGRTYRVSRTGQLHTASAPGEPPAVLYGNLRNSIGYSAVTWQGLEASIDVGVGLGVPPAGGMAVVLSYARILEWGGIAGKGARILPRPYLEPTWVRCEGTVDAMLAAA